MPDRLPHLTDMAAAPRTAALLGFVLLAAACGGNQTGEIAYTDPDRLSHFSIPAEWHLYETEELNSLADIPFVESVQGLSFPAQSVAAFDGAPSRDVTNLSVDLLEADFPIGSATVRAIGESERDWISRFVLTQSVVPYLTMTDPQEVTKEDWSFGRGYDGVRVLAAFTSEDGTSQGVAYLISVTDADDRRMYSIVAGCSIECFTEHQPQIEQVVDSWLVNTRA